jgi:hypothetical protein
VPSLYTLTKAHCYRCRRLAGWRNMSSECYAGPNRKCSRRSAAIPNIVTSPRPTIIDGSSDRYQTRNMRTLTLTRNLVARIASCLDPRCDHVIANHTVRLPFSVHQWGILGQRSDDTEALGSGFRLHICNPTHFTLRRQKVEARSRHGANHICEAWNVVISTVRPSCSSSRAPVEGKFMSIVPTCPELPLLRHLLGQRLR